MLKHVSAMAAVSLSLLSLSAVGGAAQQLHMTTEELQQFFQQNASATPEQLAQRLQNLNDRTLDMQREQSGRGYSFAKPPTLNMRSVKVYSKTPQVQAQPLTLGTGIITALSFVDDDFRPQAISRVTYDPALFSVNGSTCSGAAGGNNRGGGGGEAFDGNVLNIFPCQFWVQSATINVMLKGGAQPIIFSVSAGSNDAEPAVDAQVTVEVSDGASNAFPEFASRRLTINPVDRRASGVTPIYPSLGVITDVAFIDGYGNPWPIEEVNYQPSIVSVSGSECAAEGENSGKSAEGNGNVLYLSLCRDRSSNISVKLKDAPAALGLLLVSPGTDQAALKPDATLTVTVPGRSPAAPADNNAAASALPGSNTDSTGFQPDRFLADFANGTPPRGARFVQLLGAPSIEGYLYNGQLYLRGRYRPVNPTADASATSASGGVNVWRYNKPVNSLIVANSASGQEFSVTADY